MRIYVVCEEFFDWSDPVVAYTREEDAEDLKKIRLQTTKIESTRIELRGHSRAPE